MKKKILFISPTGTFDNGAEISIFHLMVYLKSKEHELYNVVPEAHNRKQVEYFEKCEKNGITTYFIPILKWWWEDAPGGKPGLPEERAYFYRENISEIRKIIQKEKIDLVITNTVNMFQGALAAAAEGIPHYWLLHEFPTGEFSYYRNRIDFLEEYAEKIFSVTGELHSYLEPLFSKKIGSFSPYTEIKLQPNKVGRKRRFVSVGRLTERKNQLELIQAFELTGIMDDIDLVFIGDWDDSYKNKCIDYIKSHKLKNIHFYGGLENPWSEVTDKDICILPSKLETFGLVYVEAILNGIPVIFSDNPGHLSAYELFHGGSLYRLGNVQELSEKMLITFQNFEQKKEESENFVSKARECYQIENVYKEIIIAIDEKSKDQLKPIRHVTNLFSSNEKKSRLTRIEIKIRNAYNKAKNRLNRKK